MTNQLGRNQLMLVGKVAFWKCGKLFGINAIVTIGRLPIHQTSFQSLAKAGEFLGFARSLQPDSLDHAMSETKLKLVSWGRRSSETGNKLVAKEDVGVAQFFFEVGVVPTT